MHLYPHRHVLAGILLILYRYISIFRDTRKWHWYLKIFHIRLCENFHYPYIATSVTDFWRRWHISLSLWFRDYVYIPLGGNRKGICIQIRNLMIVWILTGIWHGANWTFLSWGIYYGCLLIFEKFIWCHVQPKLPVILNWFLTMICIMIGWYSSLVKASHKPFSIYKECSSLNSYPIMNEEFLFILHSCMWILINSYDMGQSAIPLYW